MAVSPPPSGLGAVMETRVNRVAQEERLVENISSERLYRLAYWKLGTAIGRRDRMWPSKTSSLRS